MPERDYDKLGGVFAWLAEPRSHRLRSTRIVALLVALRGPAAFGAKTQSEVASIEGVSERTLRALIQGLEQEFGLTPIGRNFAGPISYEEMPNPSAHELVALDEWRHDQRIFAAETHIDDEHEY